MKIHPIPSSLPSQNSSTLKRLSHTSSKPSDSKLTTASTQLPVAQSHNPHLSSHSMCEKCYKSVSKYLNSKESEILTLINNIENTYFQEKGNWRGAQNYRKRIFELEQDNGDLKNVIRMLEQEIRGFNEGNLNSKKVLGQIGKNYYQENLELISKNMRLIEELNREMDTKSQILQQIQTLKSQLFIKEIHSCNTFFDKIEQIMHRNITKLKDQNQ